ncbi:hypothetical protein [Phycicoccus sonneratiae]|uniref:RCC1-like domain-containing protein n=1 Tax=Phycicoccus sonneratiae TaxID=2807628 RepID=A0ABS2CR09_9MICO|nr:hypothetical protein [Phycicoccus sonneraticus]MBM6402322.1 hypothetical protein [Phycicoccus sonneraticus]
MVTVVVGAAGALSGATASAAATADGTYRQQGVGFVPLTPARLLDTRIGLGAPSARVPAGGSVTVQVTGRGGVPTDGVAAVAVNATAVQPAKAGYATVYPAGSSRPVASNLNFSAGATVANHVLAKLGDGGRLTLYSNVATDLLLDLSGYYPDDAKYAPLAPARILDTRSGLGAPKARAAAGGTVTVTVLGRGGVPAVGVDAVVLNATAVAASSGGYTTVYPGGQPRPSTSTLNYASGGTVPALAIVKVGASGAVSLYTSSGADLLADVMGYIPAGSDFAPLASPTRLVDTRSGTGAPKARLSAGGLLTVTVAGAGGIPDTQVGSAILNITAVNPARSGHLTVYPTGSTRPSTSLVNYTAGTNRANSVLARLGGTGQVTVYSESATDLVVDVSGYVATPLTVTMTQPATTAVVPPETTTAVTAPADIGGAGTVTTTAPVPDPGGYLYLPPGGANGDGVVGKVTTVTSSSGVTTADIVAVPLEEAFPAGHIEGTTSAADPLLDLAPIAPGQAPALRSGARASGIVPRCTTGTSAGVTLRASAPMRVSVLADWGIGVRTHVRVSVTTSLTFEGAVELNGGVTCSWSSTPVPLGMAGPFVASGTVEVNLEVSGALQAGVAYTTTTTDGFDWWDGETPTRIHTQSKDVSWKTPNGVAKVRFSVGPSVSLKLGGAVGPYVSAGVYAEFTVDPAGAPWWTLEFGIEAKAGVKLDILFLAHQDYSLAQAVVFHTQVAQATNPYPGAGKWGKTISVGRTHACAVTPTGGVKCWGDNGSGQLGNGTYTSSRTPVQVSGLASGVVAVTAGNRFTCALTRLGAVKCWGQNLDGQLGTGSTPESTNTPLPVKGLSSGVAHLGSAGLYGACVATTSGTVMCWGATDAGFRPTLPVTVGGLPGNVTDVGGSPMVACAVAGGGAVKCWGDNEVGQLGNGTYTRTPSSLPPVQVNGLTSGVQSVSGGDGTNCAITGTGALKCWGLNSDGELGIGTVSGFSTVPVQVKGLTSGVAQVSATTPTVCAVTRAGAAKCWGDNTSGQVGNGSTTRMTSPAQVTGLTSGVTGISVGGGTLGQDSEGGGTTCATTTGGVMCWGSNISGQLGNGSSARNSAVPVHVQGL